MAMFTGFWTGLFVGLSMGALAAALVLGGAKLAVQYVKYLLHVRQERREQRKADGERRWQELRLLLLSGGITTIRWDFQRTYGHRHITLEGPGCSYECVEFRGTLEGPGSTVHLGSKVGIVLGTPGTALRDMRWLMRVFIPHIRQDREIAVLQDFVFKRLGYLEVKPASNAVVQFRKLA